MKVKVTSPVAPVATAGRNKGLWIVLGVIILFVLMILMFGEVGLIVGALLAIGILWIMYGGKGRSSGSGVMVALAKEPKWFVLLIIFVITLILAGIISLTWGMLGLLGLFLLLASFYILFMQRANVALTVRNPFVIVFGLAILFLLLSFFGVDNAYMVDLSAIPGMSELHVLANS